MSKILGYTIDDSDGTYDMELDYVEVSCKFYFEHEATNREVSEFRSALLDYLDTDITKRGFEKVEPYRISETIRRGDL